MKSINIISSLFGILLTILLGSCGGESVQNEIDQNMNRVLRRTIELESERNEELAQMIKVRVMNMEGDEIAAKIYEKSVRMKALTEGLLAYINDLKKGLIEIDGKQKYEEGPSSYALNDTIEGAGSESASSRIFHDKRVFSELDAFITKTLKGIYEQVNPLPKYEIHFVAKDEITLTTLDSAGIKYHHFRDVSKASAFLQLQRIELDAVLSLKAIHLQTLASLSHSGTPLQELRVISIPQQELGLKAGDRFDTKIYLGALLLSDLPGLRMWVDDLEIMVNENVGNFSVIPSSAGLKKHEVRVKWLNSKTGVLDELLGEISYEVN